MPRVCAVIHCGEYGAHKFPRIKEINRKWLRATRLRKNQVHSESRLCVNHFVESDYSKYTSIGTECERRFLKPKAVPSVFAWSTKPILPAARARDDRLKARNMKKPGHEDTTNYTTRLDHTVKAVEDDGVHQQPSTSLIYSKGNSDHDTALIAPLSMAAMKTPSAGGHRQSMLFEHNYCRREVQENSKKSLKSDEIVMKKQGDIKGENVEESELHQSQTKEQCSSIQKSSMSCFQSQNHNIFPDEIVMKKQGDIKEELVEESELHQSQTKEQCSSIQKNSMSCFQSHNIFPDEIVMKKQGDIKEELVEESELHQSQPYKQHSFIKKGGHRQSVLFEHNYCRRELQENSKKSLKSDEIVMKKEGDIKEELLEGNEFHQRQPYEQHSTIQKCLQSHSRNHNIFLDEVELKEQEDIKKELLEGSELYQRQPYEQPSTFQRSSISCLQSHSQNHKIFPDEILMKKEEDIKKELLEESELYQRQPYEQLLRSKKSLCDSWYYEEPISSPSKKLKIAEDILSTSDSTFLCEHCSGEFNNEFTLNHHIRSMHSPAFSDPGSFKENQPGNTNNMPRESNSPPTDCIGPPHNSNNSTSRQDSMNKRFSFECDCCGYKTTNRKNIINASQILKNMLSSCDVETSRNLQQTRYKFTQLECIKCAMHRETNCPLRRS